VNESIRIGIIGDFNPDNPTHVKTNLALGHAANLLQAEVAVAWVPTMEIEEHGPEAVLGACDGLWCSPGSPYRSMEGALRGIRFARENGAPFIGTCGGYQHAVIEFARNVLGFAEADHEESNPYASVLFVSKLVCSVFDKTLLIKLKPGSAARKYIGRDQISEHYYCNFGLNPEFRNQIEDGGMVISGEDPDGEARVLELPDHPFFIATLFLPQDSSTKEQPHPLIAAFLKAASEFSPKPAGLGAQA